MRKGEVDENDRRRRFRTGKQGREITENDVQMLQLAKENIVGKVKGAEHE